MAQVEPMAPVEDLMAPRPAGVTAPARRPVTPDEVGKNGSGILTGFPAALTRAELPAAGPTAAPDAEIAEHPRTRTLVSAGLAGVRAVGTVLVVFVLYALYATSWSQGHAQRSLSPQTHLRVSMPDIGLDQFVVGSDTRASLAKGPGVVPGSGRPGVPKPLVIVGHRVANGAPFRHLTAIRPGETITLRSPHGQDYRYSVERTVTTSPGASVELSSGPQALILVTAAPAYRDSERFVVVARLLGAAGVSATPERVALPGLPGSWTYLALGVAAMAVLGIGWAARAVVRPGGWARWATWAGAVLVGYVVCLALLRSMSPVL
jgi:LPXTG-site transpeptidase (sortase) family protein